MSRTARILTAAMSGSMALPLTAAGPEQSPGGALAAIAQTSAPVVQTVAQVVLRPYYVVPFFPFLLPASPDHPAAAPAQAQPVQPTTHFYPFLIWLPVQQPAMQPAPLAPPAPAAVKPPTGQPVTEPAIAPVQPIPPPAPATEAEPTMKEGASPLTVFKAPPQPAVEPSPLTKGAEQGPGTSRDMPVAAKPPPESVAVKEVPPKESAGPSAAPATKPKSAATRPGAAKPAQNGAKNKRKLCWKDGKLDVCK